MNSIRLQFGISCCKKVVFVCLSTPNRECCRCLAGVIELASGPCEGRVSLKMWLRFLQEIESAAGHLFASFKNEVTGMRCIWK